jgi:acid stress-induced BolA-like protein IbaG/YrbA
MVTPENIQEWISASLVCEFIKVAGDGQHFEAVIVSPEFAGKLPVARHQRVFQTLGDRMHAQIHALSMQTFTPEEWKNRNG